MPAMSPRDHNRLPRVDAPPTYVRLTGDARTRPDGSLIANRQMDPRGGVPRGPSRDKNGTADNWYEWQPGEFQRSYPKSDPKNAAWYKMHRYGRIPGTNIDGWIRLQGPPSPVEKAARTAARKKTGRG